MSEYVPPRPDTMHPEPVPPAPPMPGDASVPGRRPRVTWSWSEAIGVYLLAFLAAGFATLPAVATIHDEDLANIVASVLAALVILGVLLLWLQRFHPIWREAIGFPQRVWPELRAGVLFGLALYPVVVLGVGVVLTLLLQAVSGSEVTAPEQVSRHLPAIGTAMTVVYAIAIAPVGEELFFRGILFRSLRQRYGFAVGLAGSGALFGLVHYVPGAWQGSVLLIGVMMFTGVALAWFHARRENLLANVAAHMTFNVIGLALIYFYR